MSAAVEISLAVKNNRNYPLELNIMGSPVNPRDTSNAYTEYRYDFSSFNFTNENYVQILYKRVGDVQYSIFTAQLQSPTLQAIVIALNQLGIGYFNLYTEGSNTFIGTNNDNYVFGGVNVYNAGDPATINWTMTEYTAPLVFIDANFHVKRASDGFIYHSEFGTGSGSFTLPANVPLFLNPFSDTTQGVTTFWNTYTQALLIGSISDGLNTITSGSITLLKNNGVMDFSSSPVVSLLAGGVYNLTVTSSNPS